MTPAPDLEALRALVREVLREALQEPRTRPTAAPGAVPATAPGAPTRPPLGLHELGTPLQAVPRPGPGGAEDVRIRDDADLDAFVHRLLALFDNPKAREDLRARRLRFRLAGFAARGTTAGPVHRVERGAVTEAVVRRAAAEGARLVLGPEAVLTPLGRDRARAAGVTVEKERAC